MIWIAIGIVAGIAAAPVLIWALAGLVASLKAIDDSLTDIVGECRQIVATLDAVPALVETEQMTAAVPGLVGNYVKELTPLI